MRPIHKMTPVTTGAVLYHSAFGFAVVTSVSNTEASLKWDKSTTWLPSQVTKQQLEDSYSLCRTNGFFHKATHEPRVLRTMLHVDPGHAISLLLRDLNRPQSKQDLHDWIVGQNLLTNEFFDEWWYDLLRSIESSHLIKSHQDVLSLSQTAPDGETQDAVFPDDLTPAARLNLALSMRSGLSNSDFLQQVCKAWSTGSSQVRDLALQACSNADPNQIIERLLLFDAGDFSAIIHCLRQSRWVPAQLNAATLQQLNARATNRLTPESPLDSEARLAATLLRWGHPGIEESLALCIHSPDGQRLLYSLTGALTTKRALELLRSLFTRSMSAEHIPDAHWCSREWSLRTLKSIADLAAEETDPQVSAWLTQIDQPPIVVAESDTVLATKAPNQPVSLADFHPFLDQDALSLTIGMAKALDLHHTQKTRPIITAETTTFYPPDTIYFEEMGDASDPDYCHRDDIYSGAVLILEALIGRKLPDHLKPHRLLPYLRQFRPDLPPRLLGMLTSPLAQTPLLRPSDGSTWLALVERLKTSEAIPVNNKLYPEIAYESHIGHQKLMHRQTNQDSLYAQTYENCALALVCDGVSRSDVGSGDQASRIASRTVSELWSHSQKKLKDAPWVDLVSFLERAIATANIAITNTSIRAISGSSPGRVPMASTIVAAICRGNRVSISWMGDSRAYIISPSGASLLTADHHTAANTAHKWRTRNLTDLGALSTSLSRYLGSNLEFTCPMTLELQTIQLTLALDERLLLCSDGISNFIGDEPASFERIMIDTCTHSPLQSSSTDLVNLANRAGGWDNATCVILRAI